MALLPYAPDDRRDGVVGLSFAMRQVAQLLLMCDRQDVGISIDSGNSADEEPRIFIYDNYPGGIGFSEPLFQMQDELLERTRALIAGCDCERGCPTCVGPVGNTGPLAKTVALRILDLIAAAPAALRTEAEAIALAQSVAERRIEAASLVNTLLKATPPGGGALDGAPPEEALLDEAPF